MSKTKTVLVIDDDGDMAATAGLRLEFAGYRVLTCRDAQTGFNLAVERRPDVILLDLRMPETDGLATLARLHRCEEARSIPVVVFSVDRDRRREAVAMGVRHYVDKPYDPSALVKTIERAIADSMAPASIPQRSIQDTIQSLEPGLGDEHGRCAGPRAGPCWSTQDARCECRKALVQVLAAPCTRRHGRGAAVVAISVRSRKTITYRIHDNECV